jgi:hypothetical protein
VTAASDSTSHRRSASTELGIIRQSNVEIGRASRRPRPLLGRSPQHGNGRPDRVVDDAPVDDADAGHTQGIGAEGALEVDRQRAEELLPEMAITCSGSTLSVACPNRCLV